jgi:hypothetical protein
MHSKKKAEGLRQDKGADILALSIIIQVMLPLISRHFIP